MNLRHMFTEWGVNPLKLTDKKQQTDKKIEYVRDYVIRWAEISAARSDVHTITFIDCMSNAGVYRDGDCCTAIEVLKVFCDVAGRYPQKVFRVLCNDNDGEKIEILKKVITSVKTGVQNVHICTSVSDVNAYLDKEAFPVLNVMSSTIRGSSERKLGGKTPNAPRTLPIPDSLYMLLRARREIVERKIAAGEITTPIERLPIVCRGNNYTERCKSGDLTVAGKKVFQEIKLDENVVADVAFELGQRFAEEDYSEKDVTSYFLRRNFATHIAILGCTQDEAHYLMGHAIFSRENEKSVMINPKALNRLKRMLEKRPIVGSSANGKKQAIKLTSRKYNQDGTDSGLVGKTEAQEVHIIGNVTAREAKELRMTVNVKEPQAATIFLSTIPADITQSDSSVSVLETYYKMYGIKE